MQSDYKTIAPNHIPAAPQTTCSWSLSIFLLPVLFSSIQACRQIEFDCILSSKYADYGVWSRLPENQLAADYYGLRVEVEDIQMNPVLTAYPTQPTVNMWWLCSQTKPFPQSLLMCQLLSVQPSFGQQCGLQCLLFPKEMLCQLWHKSHLVYVLIVGCKLDMWLTHHASYLVHWSLQIWLFLNNEISQINNLSDILIIQINFMPSGVKTITLLIKCSDNQPL